MVVFGAKSATFFIFILDVLCFGQEGIEENKALRDCQELIGRKKVLFYTFCTSFVEEEEIYNIILSEEEYEEFTHNYHDLCKKPTYPTLYSVVLLPSDLCNELSTILYSGFMDIISRLPPPGGTTAFDIFRTVIIASYHLSSHFIKEFQNISSSFRVDIVFDADYETVLGESVTEFQNFLLWHLKRIFQRSQSDIHTLMIRRGSIGITFFINAIDCVHTKSKINQYKILEESHFIKDQRKYRLTNNMEMNSKYQNFLKHMNLDTRQVPHTVKTSLQEDVDLTRKQQFFNNKIFKRNVFKSKEYSSSGISSISTHNDQELDEEKSVIPKESLKLKVSGEENLFSSDNIFLADENLYRSRKRRYVASEGDTAMKLKVQFRLEKSPKNGDTEEFRSHLVTQLAKAMRVPIPSINDLKILSDKNYVIDDVGVIEAADFLKNKIQSQKLRLKDLNGQLLLTVGNVLATVDEASTGYSVVILVMLCITLFFLTALIIATVYIARKTSQNPCSTKRRKEVRLSLLQRQEKARLSVSGRFQQAYKNFQGFGRDSSQSIGKYSYDSGLWLGPGPEPNFTVPEAPYYRPPTVEQIASTPRPITAVRTRLKKNWNVDERALSTIPDDYGRNYLAQDTPPPR